MVKKYKTILLLTTMFIFFFTATGIVFAQTVSPSALSQYNFIALGDSLAAGMTPYPPAAFPQFEIDKSYNDFIAEKLSEEGVLGSYTNFGFPGYTTQHVLGLLQPPYPLPYYTRDLQPVLGNVATEAISNADMITLSVGANDLLPLIYTSNMAGIPGVISQVELNIGAIIDNINFINDSNPKIYIMGYYNAFPYYPESIQELLLPQLEALNDAIQRAAEENGATYIDTQTIINKHIAKYIPNEENIHPSLFGYKAIAKEFWNIIKVDFMQGLE